MSDIHCEMCGKPMGPPKKRGVPKHYCGDACRAAAWRQGKQKSVWDRITALEVEVRELRALVTPDDPGHLGSSREPR